MFQNLQWNFFYLAALNDVINADGWRIATPEDFAYFHRTNKLSANVRGAEFGAALLLSWYGNPNQRLALDVREQITANMPEERQTKLPLVIPIANLGVKDSPICKSGLLFEIKYFHSDRQHFTGRKRKVPQVVVGVEIERVQELGLLWMNRRNAELAIHPAQITILEEIALQLKTFAEYAKRTEKNELASLFEKELEKITELLEASAPTL